MTLGELFLEAMSTGVITNGEMAWVTARQDQFTRTEEAVAQRLGRLIDEGTIQLGCRMPCLLYTSPSPRDVEESRMPSSA